jgi:hypothetical protein
MMESISSDEELILLSAASAAVIVMRRRRRRRLKHQRKLWSKPWLLERDGVRGISNFVRYELSDDTSGFFGFLRMSPHVFQKLLNIVTPSIKKQDTFMRDSISAEDMLIVTLRYLASGR